MTTRSALGRLSRRKGKAFELVVRDQIRAAVPSLAGLTIRRSSQAERAWDADLIIEGSNLPNWLVSLWLECEHANEPDPRAKLEQARRDAERYAARVGRQRLPLVVWRRTRSRVIYASTDVGTMMDLLGRDPRRGSPGSTAVVTMTLRDLLTCLVAA